MVSRKPLASHGRSSAKGWRSCTIQLAGGWPNPPGRWRPQEGGGEGCLDKSDLESLLESTTRGDPEAPLRWTCKSVRQLTAELKRVKHQISHQVVADLLHELGYSLQANRKTTEGTVTRTATLSSNT